MSSAAQANLLIADSEEAARPSVDPVAASSTYGATPSTPRRQPTGDGTGTSSVIRAPGEHYVAATASPSTIKRGTAKASARIGPYTLGKTLGEGTSGKVKLAQHSETGQRVAIKIIGKATIRQQNELSRDTDRASKKMEREIAVMKIVHHPHVLSLYDVYESAADLFLVMELVEGGELFDYISSNGRLDEAESLRLFQQIIHGVHHCHKNLIIHRDLKPENVLLDANRNVKIADFGMAGLQHANKLLETACGSPHYASPEIVKNVPYDGTKSDTWSCGVILYAMLAGYLPFDEQDQMQLLRKIKNGTYTMAPHFSADAADLISRILVVDPRKRYTMSDIKIHAFFTRTIFRLPAGKKDASIEPNAEAWSDAEIDQIDEDIFESMKSLDFGSFESIVAALRKPELNSEKVFCTALIQKRNEALETYDVAAEPLDATLPRRRLGSHTSRTSLFGGSTEALSKLSIHGDLGVDTTGPASPGRSRVTSDHRAVTYRHSPLVHRSADALMQPVVEKPVTEPVDETTVLETAVADSADETTVMEKPDEPSAKPIAVVSSVVTTPSQPTAPVITNVISAAMPKLSLMVETYAAKLAQDRLRNEENIAAPSPTESMMNLAMVPKKSWFTAMFKFSPEAEVFTTSHDNITAAKSYIEQKLQSESIIFENSRTSDSLKCFYDGKGTLPDVRFKVSFSKDVVAAGDGSGSGVRVSFQQQKGARSTFQVVVSQIRAHW